jgi:hypothetical protein
MIGAAWVATFAEPCGILLAGYIAGPATEAGLAIARGEYVAFKSTLAYEIYDGGYCKSSTSRLSRQRLFA